jgi:hypothetical protein
MLLKATKPNLYNCGLNRAKPLLYKVGEWVYPDEVNNSSVSGGLWVGKNKGYINWFSRYVLETRGYEPLIWECEIGSILYETSNRIKTNRVKLLRRQ